MSGQLLCPRCGDAAFRSISELQLHVITRHTYETLLLLSQTHFRGSGPGAPLPLPSPAEGPTQSLSLGAEQQERPSPLDLALSSPSALVLAPGLGLNLDRLSETFLTMDLALGPGLEQRLGLGLDLRSKVVQTLAEVEERVNRKVGRLESRLDHKEALLQRQRRTEDRLKTENQELDSRVAQLSGQVKAAEELMVRLRTALSDRDAELCRKQLEMEQIEAHLRALAQKEAEAKVKLQVFIESLLDRAERAEKLLLSSPPHPDLSRLSLEDLDESKRNQRSFSVSDSDALRMHSVWTQTRTLSLGSPPEDDAPTTSIGFVQEGWGQTWSKPTPCLHSNQEEEPEPGPIQD